MKVAISIIEEIANRWAWLGSCTLKNGTKIIGHVKHVGSEAYFNEIYSCISDEEIFKLEKRLKRQLPPFFKEFLKYANGINLFSDSLSIEGYRTDYSREGDATIQPYSLHVSNIYERPEDANSSQFFFGSYSWDGPILYTDPAKSPKIYRSSMDSVTPLNEWPDFETFLLSEVERLSKLFDENGVKIDPDLPTTPV